MIDLRSLEVFFWVVKLGGFGRAAERLRMTQPGVSQRIGQVEARYKVRLLDRSGNRPPVPTPKGLEVYAFAERMLSLHSDLIARLTEPGDLSGTIRLGVSETLVHTLLAALIRQLHDRHPGVTPEITVALSIDLRAALLAGELDVAFLVGPLTEPRVRNVPLGDYAMVWVAAPALDLGPGRLGLPELALWPILAYARRSLPHTQIETLFSRSDLPPARIFANSSIASILRMAVDGIGIGILPEAVVAGDLAEGRLRRLDVEPEITPLRFTASYIRTPESGLAELVATLAGELAAGSNRAPP